MYCDQRAELRIVFVSFQPWRLRLFYRKISRVFFLLSRVYFRASKIYFDDADAIKYSVCWILILDRWYKFHLSFEKLSDDYLSNAKLNKNMFLNGKFCDLRDVLSQVPFLI
jgi:hypothetical protein